MRKIDGGAPLRASSRGMICSSSMRRSSRGTPGVKKNRARPISIAKPQAVPIGLSSISAPAGSIACLRLFGGILRARRREEILHPRQPFLVQFQLDAGRLRRDFLRQVIDRRAEPAIDDHRIGAPAGQAERLQQTVAVVADRGAPMHGKPDILELLAM